MKTEVQAENLFIVGFPNAVPTAMLLKTFAEAAAVLNDGRYSVQLYQETDASGVVRTCGAEIFFDCAADSPQPVLHNILIGGEKLSLDATYSSLPLYLSRAGLGWGMLRPINIQREPVFQTLLQKFTARWKILLQRQ